MGHFGSPVCPPAGALLILGGLMLNLVATSMLLRPIQVKPAASSKCASPSQKSPAVSLKSSSEKDNAKSYLNGSSHLSNGISKSDSLASPPQEPVGTRDTKEQSENPEASRLVLNGHESHQNAGPCKPAADGSLELNGTSNGSAPVGVLAAHGEESPLKAKVLDFSLLKDPFFCIYTWSLVFSQLAYFIPYFHLSARARTLGIDPMDASFIISVAGKAHTEHAVFSPHTCQSHTWTSLNKRT